MKTIPFFLLLQSFVAFKEIRGQDISAYFAPCSAKDPNLNECVKTTGQKLLPLVANGDEVLNVKPIDPMKTPAVTFHENTGGNDLVVNYKNVVQTGFSSTIIDGADIDLAHGVMTFKLKYPCIEFIADYEAKGGLFNFNVDGRGKANITVWNAYSSLVLKYHVIDDHIKIKSVIMGFSFDKIYLDYTSLRINDDDELSASASTFINENSGVIIDGFKPQLEKFYSQLTGNFLQAFFDAVPYSVLFKGA